MFRPSTLLRPSHASQVFNSFFKLSYKKPLSFLTSAPKIRELTPGERKWTENIEFARGDGLDAKLLSNSPLKSPLSRRISFLSSAPKIRELFPDDIKWAESVEFGHGDDLDAKLLSNSKPTSSKGL